MPQSKAEDKVATSLRHGYGATKLFSEYKMPVKMRHLSSAYFKVLYLDTAPQLKDTLVNPAPGYQSNYIKVKVF